MSLVHRIPHWAKGLPLLALLLDSQDQLIAQTTTSTASTTTTTSITTTTVPSAYRRYFPKMIGDSTQTTGLAIVNLSSSPANLSFKAYSNSGSLLATDTRSLQPRNQLAQLVSEIFPKLADIAGWLVLESNVPGVEGFFLLFDFNLTIMDGAAVSGTALKDFLLPAADEGDLSLVNPSNSRAGCTIEYVTESGLSGISTPITIPPMGRTTTPIGSLRPAGVKGGYLRCRGDGVVPLAVIGKPGWIAVLNGIDFQAQAAAVETREAGAPLTLYAPQYAAGDGFATVMDIINLEAVPTSITLKLVGDNGVQIGTIGSLNMPPQGSARIDKPSVFGLSPGANLVQGYVQIQSAGGRFNGWVRFTDPEEKLFGSALQFVGTGLTTTYFSQVAQNDLFFTGLAAINPNPRATTVTITAYDINGTSLANARREIPPEGRFSKLLPELVGTLPPLTKGYFAMNSDLPVASFALFGTNSLDVLAAIPPQFPSDVPTTSTTTTRTTTTLGTTSTTSSTTTSTRTTTTLGTTSTASSTTTSTRTTTTLGTTSTTSSTTTTTTRPPFSPSVTINLDTLSAGKAASMELVGVQGAGEITLRKAEIQFDGGRVNFSELTAGKQIGQSELTVPSTLVTVNIVNTVISNDGKTVTTEFSISVPLLLPKTVVATSELQNTVNDGVSIKITTIGQKVQVLGNSISLFEDGSLTATEAARPTFSLGKIFILPTQVGRAFKAQTKITSVLYPVGGTASTKDVSQSFTTGP